MAASETFALVPVGFYDFSKAAPGSGLLKLLRFGRSTRALRDLHLSMVIYAKTEHAQGYVPDYMVGLLAYPDSPASAKRSALRLAEAGLVEVTEGGYYVPAAENWPPLQRTGTRDPIPDHIRRRVYERDGFQCVKCASAEKLTLDHIIPWSEYGPDSEDNLRTYCSPCNTARGTKAG